MIITALLVLVVAAAVGFGVALAVRSKREFGEQNQEIYGNLLGYDQATLAGFKETPSCENFYVITPDPAAPSAIEGTVTLGQMMGAQPR